MSTLDEPMNEELATSTEPSQAPASPRIWYTDPLLDVEAMAAAAAGKAVYSLGLLPTLAVSGKDRLSWLNGLLTCDTASVRPSVAAWGLLLDRVGKVQAGLAVVAHREKVLIGVLWGNVHEVHQQLDMRLVMEDADLEVVDDWHWSVGLGSLDAAPDDSAAWGNAQLAGACSVVAEPSFTLDGSRVSLSDPAWALWRLRHELPWGGIDFDASVRPHEAALDRKAVSWSKGCYLGQEVVCMQDMRGKVKKRLAVFTSIGDALTEQTPSGVVLRAGIEVGRVTSAIYEANERRWTLFAMVPTAVLPPTGAQPHVAGEGSEGSLRAYDTELQWQVSANSSLALQWVPFD